MDQARVKRIEWATLAGQRPRKAGCNARLGDHGSVVHVPFARITLEDGTQGFGASSCTIQQAGQVIGKPLSHLFDAISGSIVNSASGHAPNATAALDYPLWDLMAKRQDKPVYALAATMVSEPAVETETSDELRVPCYDTSLYIDDLGCSDEDEAAELIAAEAREGWARGHRAFKIKVGRGAMHMPLEEGTRTDIAVVRAVRKVVGDAAPIMLDANNGYNLNITKRVLQETADCNIHWMEEPFHEDAEFYTALNRWIQEEGLRTLVADGEGAASPDLLKWAERGLVQVVQYDILSYGFTRWLALGPKLQEWNAQAAPHHYGRFYGNYATCHLAAALPNLAFVEWDEAEVDGLRAPGYAIEDGYVNVPASTGFGLELDEEIFDRAVAENGYCLSWI